MQDTPTHPSANPSITDTNHRPRIQREAIKKIVHEKVVLNAGYINGEWSIIEPSNQPTQPIEAEQELSNQHGLHPLYDPSMGAVIASTRLCDQSHVDRAAHAAANAFATWSQTSVSERADYLEAIASAMQAQFDTLVGLSVLNNGKPIEEATIDVSDAIACYRYYANLLTTQHTQPSQPNTTQIATNETGIRLLKTYAPVGVCALIVPWNFPMVTTAWKLAPALAAGCTVLLKPSELTLLPELLLGNILTEIGLPKGVVNILPGGATVGTAMTQHPLIDKVSFTGSNGVGEQVMVQAASGIKDISLELGGKSAIVVRADADVQTACELIIGGIFSNAGQICSATSRLLVHADIAEALFEQLKIATENLTIGDGFDPDTQMGPVVSERQQQQVQKYFAIATSENLTCLTGGSLLQRQGYFVSPTIYIEVPTDSRLWQEEIFGPVLVCHTFRDDAKAIDLANDSQFALAASVVSQDEAVALSMAMQIQAGHIWINEQQIVVPEAGWGGFKQSGIGRELGTDGLAAYQKSKHILLPKAD
ncbi:aldehyde dehydrogenase family protein [Psychrobacter sp. I-STPA10]|uniref:aldehyde dehydrogenase family protein n=1 Tax=Psychrobacter sp. I-STPA10 TaxID=2585769 RepID=UPI001E294EEA|nr:aldehyde dehydrogenase family protein [Psychrobacter sp. I-STPA10]